MVQVLRCSGFQDEMGLLGFQVFRLAFRFVGRQVFRLYGLQVTGVECRVLGLQAGRKALMCVQVFA